MSTTSKLLRRCRSASIVVLASAWLMVAHAQMGPLQDLDTFPSGELTITDGKKLNYTFRIWLADTPQRQAQGLMFVRSLPDLRGMLFTYQQPKSISMWMKNTYIPLDMVFIDAHGRIQQVVEQATPHSLDLIRSNEPAMAVLEIAGGEARRLGIRAGQQVRHPAFAGHRS